MIENPFMWFIGGWLIVPMFMLGLYFVIQSYLYLKKKSGIASAVMIVPIISLTWFHLVIAVAGISRELSGLEEGAVGEHHLGPVLGALYSLIFIVLFYRGMDKRGIKG